MSTKHTRHALAKAFREVTLGLVGLFDVYDAEPELVDAVTDALGRIFRAHLDRSDPQEKIPGRGSALHDLADEMETAANEAA
jgi:hypothetical protein